MTRLQLTCECGELVDGDVGGSATFTCASCGAVWLVGAAIMVAGELPLEVGIVFLHGRGVEHVDAGTGRTACGLELELDVQLSIGGRRCRWCEFVLAGARRQLAAAA